MNKPFRLLWMFIVALMISACGGIHTGVVTQPDSIAAFKEITLLPPEVSSQEQNSDATAINRGLKDLATEELQSLMNRKQIALSGSAKATVRCSIEIVYGNRALRHWVGFGAGTGHIRIRIELKDINGLTRYATKSEADLSIGLFGGDMSEVARDAVRTAIKEFGAQL